MEIAERIAAMASSYGPIDGNDIINATPVEYRASTTTPSLAGRFYRSAGLSYNSAADSLHCI